MSADVRLVRDDEWQALRDLRLRALSTDETAFGQTLADARRRTDDEWRFYGENTAGSVTFVAVDDAGRFVGMARGRELDARDAGLFGMWVAPEARRGGVGRRLVESVVAWARTRGVARIVLDVATDRPAPQALYVACGFRDTGRRSMNESWPDVEEIAMECVFD
jgi:ribosomal protein S18 acetylase RimI-like enzyme